MLWIEGSDIKRNSCTACVVIVSIPVLHHVNNSHIMNDCSNDHTKVEQLVAGEPNVKFAWPEAFRYSEAVNQYSNHIGGTHSNQIA
jgi:hypothetical protein